MNRDEILRLVEKIGDEVSDFTIGFVKVCTHDKVQDALPAGSGSLVSIGSGRGILTAAHVLESLPNTNKTQIGLVRFPRVQPIKSERLVINMEQAEKLIIGTGPFNANGPDLGFLRLSSEDVGTLEARGNVFFNLQMRQEAVLANNQPGDRYFDAISGMVALWTKDLLHEDPRARVKTFNALFGIGLVVKEHTINEHDLYDFEVTYGPGSASPDSYEGMSGGALWRVYCAKDGDGNLSVVDKKVFGVAFHQSDIANNRRIITCHGPKSVYGTLIEAIRKKWPE